MSEILHLPPAPVSPLAREARVRTRDGVHLATDVYLPGAPDRADETPGDTVLIRLPYDKSGSYTFIPVIAEHFMRHGYRVVAQDVRGKFRSEGEQLLFVNEVNDGYDTIEWIINQPWSNGRVAMWGESYYGYTQWAAVASGHPALKAIAPRVTGTQLGEPVHRHPDDRTRAVEMGITNMYALTHFYANDTYLWEPDWTRRDFAAQAEAFMAEHGHRATSYDQWVPHPVSLRRFPNESPFAGRSVPTLQTIGWWDNCAPLSWRDVAEIQQRPGWDVHHYLRIEAIDHESYRLLEPPQDRVEARSDAQTRELVARVVDPALEFFEVFVRGEGSARDIPRVTWNLAGTDEMRTAECWPPAGATRVRLFADPHGALALQAPAAAESRSWVHDPLDLVPSSVPDAFSYLLYLPDEAPVGERADVLSFTTAPLAADVELAGAVSASVRAWSTGPVMDVFVRLLDVAPDGTAVRIARGQLQLRNATAPEQLEIAMDQVGYRVAAGHRLRLHVSSSDYPEFIPQPGTGADPWCDGELTERNTQHIALGGPGGLTIELPVLRGELA